MHHVVNTTEIARSGVLGAAALLLPVLFHIVRLGHVFMPMYIPLVLLAFLVGPVPAMGTALLAPLLSAALTGMPPFYPPVAVFMAAELTLMCGMISVAARWRPGLHPVWILVPVLVIGRFLNVGMVYVCAALLGLPEGFVAGLSLLTGWPGVVLMTVSVPPIVSAVRGKVPGRGGVMA